MLNAARRKRGIHSLVDLEANSERRPGSSCWWWLGCMSVCRDGQVQGIRIYGLDRDRQEKRVMSGPLAVYHLKHGTGPGKGRVAYMRCLNVWCCSPDHVGAGTHQELGAHISGTGIRRGMHLEAKRQSLAKAHAALGHLVTPPAVVEAIRSAPQYRGVVVDMARRFGVSKCIASRIRKRKTFASQRSLTGLAATAVQERSALEQVWQQVGVAC